MKKLFLAVMILSLAMLAHSQSFNNTTVIKTEAEYQQEIQRVTNLLSNPEQINALMDMATDNSPTLRAFEEEMDLYEEEILQQKRNWVSSFRLGVNIFSANTIAGENNQSVTTYGVLPNLGLTLSIDPEKLVNRRSYVRQAEDKRRRTEYQQQSQSNLLQTNIMTAHYEYLTALKAVIIRMQLLETRQQYLDAYEIDFKNGTRNFDQLLILQQQIQLAEESLMTAQVECMKKKSEIEIMIGI